MNAEKGAPLPHLYIFLDEGGNFDFSPNGTKYFTLTSITTTRPFTWDAELMSLKFDEIERGSNGEYFHATEDAQVTRNEVFTIIANHVSAIRVDTIIVEKRKAVPALRPEEKIYPEMLGYLLRFVLSQERDTDFADIIVMTDAIPVKSKRKVIEKAVKETLARMLPDGVNYRILHHDSKSCISLQVADYCNWAIYRKWDKSDERSYSTISSAIRSEFDIFRRGRTYHY